MDTFTPEQLEQSKNFTKSQIDLYNKSRAAGADVNTAFGAALLYGAKSAKAKEEVKVGIAERASNVARTVTSITGGGILAQGLGQAIAAPSIDRMQQAADANTRQVAQNLLQAIERARAEGNEEQVARYTQLLGELEFGTIQQGFIESLPTNREIIGDSLRLVGTVGGLGVGSPLARAGATGQLTRAGSFAGGALRQGLTAGIREGVFTGAAWGAGDAIANDADPLGIALQTLGGGLAGGAGGAAIGGAIGGAISVAPAIGRSAGRASGRLRDLFSRTASVADEAVPTGTPPTGVSATRQAAEQSAPSISFQERLIGLTPDVKRRIQQAGPEKVQEYIDVALARNFDDTLPTAYEYGSRQANRALESLEDILSDTGKGIGATRQKLGTYQASVDDLADIESTFIDQLGKLNLTLRNGRVVSKPNAITTASAGDLNTLTEIYNNFQVVKRSPTLENLIDFRSSVDANINFKKMAREASGEIDPLSRQVRKVVADKAAKIVGPSEAAEVTKYSEFMDAYNDLKRYTDREAGGAYLLRVALSGRGEEARKVIATIKEYTGQDLLDDATLMKLVTDHLANQNQKTLFAQQITRAGLDAVSLLGGSPTGILSTVANRGIDLITNPERIILNAARQ